MAVMVGIGAVGELSGRALDDTLLALDRERRRIEADLIAVIARADEVEHYAADGHATVAAWAEATGNWSRSEAKARVRLGRMGRDLPTVLPALRSGALGVAQVHELGRLWANPRARRYLPGSEELLVGQAQQLWFDEFRVLCRRWEALADEDGAHRDHEHTRAARTVSAAIVGSEFRLDAQGDVLAGTEMMEILERFAEAEFHADWDQARQRYGDAACPGLLERTAGQRRFDALHAMCLAAASSPGSPVGPEPLVSIVVDLDTYENHLRRAAGLPAEPIDPACVVARRCETVAGHSVDGAEVVAASLLGRVRRVVMDSAGRIVDVGHARRVFTRAAREAIGLADRECTWPGCHVPTGMAQCDHTVPYAARGPSNVTNGGPLCGRHNRRKNRGYRTWLDPDGRWHHYRPDGTEIAPHGPAP